MNKILNKNYSKNTIVYVLFTDDTKKQCECVGVLIKEEKDYICVAFNAIDDIVRDRICIPIKKILSLSAIDDTKIMVFK